MGVPEDGPKVAAIDDPEEGEKGETPIEVTTGVGKGLFFGQTMRAVYRWPGAATEVALASASAAGVSRSSADETLLLVDRLHRTPSPLPPRLRSTPFLKWKEGSITAVHLMMTG